MLSQEEIKQEISRLIKELEPDAEIILYGSRARGDAGEHSDWDILVLLDSEEVTLKKEQQIRHHLFDLELRIDQPISIYAHSKQKWQNQLSVTPYYSNVANEGIFLK
ncbi:nucleotidyltransferase domain-containing protein [Marinoscillum sp.]|uniref:nucleotidyltransferase domain-containing protein n=1 Tax=Marinoscillum sp. TaxID=2024838 RepID=UPI003BAA0FAE